MAEKLFIFPTSAILVGKIRLNFFIWQSLRNKWQQNYMYRKKKTTKGDSHFKNSQMNSIIKAQLWHLAIHDFAVPYIEDAEWILNILHQSKLPHRPMAATKNLFCFFFNTVLIIFSQHLYIFIIFMLKSAMHPLCLLKPEKTELVYILISSWNV